MQLSTQRTAGRACQGGILPGSEEGCPWAPGRGGHELASSVLTPVLFRRPHTSGLQIAGNLKTRTTVSPEALAHTYPECRRQWCLCGWLWCMGRRGFALVSTFSIVDRCCSTHREKAGPTGRCSHWKAMWEGKQFHQIWPICSFCGAMENWASGLWPGTGFQAELDQGTSPWPFPFSQPC